MTLSGDNGSADEIKLFNAPVNFSRGAVDKFAFTAKDVGSNKRLSFRLVSLTPWEKATQIHLEKDTLWESMCEAVIPHRWPPGCTSPLPPLYAKESIDQFVCGNILQFML